MLAIALPDSRDPKSSSPSSSASTRTIEIKWHFCILGMGGIALIFKDFFPLLHHLIWKIMCRFGNGER